MSTITVIYTRTKEESSEPQVFDLPESGELPITVPKNHEIFPSSSRDGTPKIVTVPKDCDPATWTLPDIPFPVFAKENGQIIPLKTERYVTWINNTIRLDFEFLNSETRRKQKQREENKPKPSRKGRIANSVLDSYHHPALPEMARWIAMDRQLDLAFFDTDTGDQNQSLRITTLKQAAEALKKEQILTAISSFPFIRDYLIYMLDGELRKDPARQSKIKHWHMVSASGEKGRESVIISDSLIGIHRAIGINKDSPYAAVRLYADLKTLIAAPPRILFSQFNKNKEEYTLEGETAFKVKLIGRKGALTRVEFELPKPYIKQC